MSQRPGVRAHQSENVFSEEDARQGKRNGSCQSHDDGLDRGIGCFLAILLADAARHQRGGCHRQADGDGIDQSHDRFCQPDCGDGGRAERRNEKNIDDCKSRFHGHLEHHRDRQQENRPANAALRVIHGRAAQRVAQIPPQCSGSDPRMTADTVRLW